MKQKYILYPLLAIGIITTYILLSPKQTSPSDIAYEVIAKNLELPWSINFLPNGNTLVTGKEGILIQITPEGTIAETPVPEVHSRNNYTEPGLLGLALHPNFKKNNLLYIYFTTIKRDGTMVNKVDRLKFSNNTLSNRKTIIDNIPAARIHNGGRIAFGPDGYLYITTGDVGEAHLAQNKTTVAGKILRVTEDGAPAPNNPYGTKIYSMGHRNPQGIAWDRHKNLWSTEHGGDGHDEINMIKKGGNYGWPKIEGDRTQKGYNTPVRHSGKETWAPSGMAIVKNKIFFGGLYGQALYEYNIKTGQLKEHFKDVFGRIRAVRYKKKENVLYIATSDKQNRRANKIIKVYLNNLHKKDRNANN